ncbi:MAG: response regulator [Lewinellaceae bacterium]|nr:response regulator [Lewinellaceae bacterium]MCB9332925.1 response regulator [Lewinellaceae bacterium]
MQYVPSLFRTLGGHARQLRNGYLWQPEPTPGISVMEKNRARLRRKTGLLLLVIYLAVAGFMVIAYLIQNDLEQDGIVYDTQLERGITTLLFCLFWTIASYQLYRNIMRAFDQRSQSFDEQEMRIRSAHEAARLREQFMANMSHEIRTPLNAIIGFAALLNRENLSARQQELNTNIRIASENLLAIVNDILDLSKIEAGMIPLENTAFELPGLLRSLKQLFAARAAEKKLTLELDLAADLPERLLGDPTRLTQILVNLIGNALKFTEKGSVHLRAGVSRQDAEHTWLQLSVEDTGIGIPADKLDLIFERFIQADAETTRLYGGTGLGLAIVKQLVTAMKGSIRVESTPGKGTIFTLVLPFRQATQASETLPKPEEKTEIPTGVRLLVVEDNPMNQRMLQLQLEAWNLPYTLAENGRRAIELLEKSPTAFDLILMDIQMPEMDGYAATKFIREQLNLSVPIIAMTAHVLAGEREKCLRIGMNGYVSKPIREQELLDLLGQQMPRSVELPEQPRIDYNYLSETFQGNADQLQELAGIFLEQVNKEMTEIAAALDAAQPDTAARIAHSMKSTVGYMGYAQNIGLQLARFEQQCHNNPDIGQLRADFARIRKAVGWAKSQVEKEFIG